MNDLGWRADGIERAIAAGGVPLEIYRRPGFEAGRGVRRADGDGAGGGIPFDPDPYPYEDWPEDQSQRSRSQWPHRT